MRYKWLLIGLLIIILVLTGCQSKEATEEPLTGTQGVPYPSNNENVGNGQGEPYPGASTANGQVYVPYPDIQDGSDVEWKLAKYFIEWGFVDKIVYIDPPNVVVMLKDGRSLKSTEPENGALLVLINSCGPVCKAIEIQQ